MLHCYKSHSSKLRKISAFYKAQVVSVVKLAIVNLLMMSLARDKPSTSQPLHENFSLKGI